LAKKPELKKTKTIRDILLGFFGRRPTTQALEAKGILKKALVFGLSLEELEKAGKVTNGVVCVVFDPLICFLLILNTYVCVC
jgi:hypothetical protein